MTNFNVNTDGPVCIDGPIRSFWFTPEGNVATYSEELITSRATHATNKFGDYISNKWKNTDIMHVYNKDVMMDWFKNAERQKLLIEIGSTNGIDQRILYWYFIYTDITISISRM
jgi:hypothetical protein